MEPALRPILELLIQKQGDIATYDELAAYSNKVVADGAITTAISRIKKRIPGDWFENSKGKGYRLKQSPQLIDEKVAQSHSRNKLYLASAVVLFIVFIFFSYKNYEPPLIIISHQNITDRDGPETYGLLSPDGKTLVYKYEKSIWLKNIETGTENKIIPENFLELNAWSDDGQRFLYHQTDTQGNCSFNEYLLKDKNSKKLFDCLPGLNSLGATYGETLDTVYYTDVDDSTERQSLYQYDRINGQSHKIFTMSKKGHGIYRVYYFANSLIFLTSSDWNSTDVYQLMLETMENKLLTHFSRAQRTIGIDNKNADIYGIDEHNNLIRYNILSAFKSVKKLPFVASPYIHFNEQTNQLLIDEKVTRDRKLIKSNNPLIHNNVQTLDSISSSGSDYHPVACRDFVYFLSNRTGNVEFWRYNQKTRAKRRISNNLTNSISSFDISSNCEQLIYVNDAKQIVLTQVNNWKPVILKTNEAFEAQFGATTDQIIFYTDTKGLLNVYNIEDKTNITFPDAPLTFEFLQLADGEHMYLKETNSNWIWKYSLLSGEKKKVTQIPVSCNCRWQLVGENIYFLSNEGTPTLGYFNAQKNMSIFAPLDQNFYTSMIALGKNEENIWFSPYKQGQSNIQLIQLDN